MKLFKEDSIEVINIILDCKIQVFVNYKKIKHEKIINAELEILVRGVIIVSRMSHLRSKILFLFQTHPTNRSYSIKLLFNDIASNLMPICIYTTYTMSSKCSSLTQSMHPPFPELLDDPLPPLPEDDNLTSFKW